MRSDCPHIGPDSVSAGPDAGALRSLAGIAERDSLAFAEAAAITKRAVELKTKPVKIKDSNALFAIHRHLFQDIAVGRAGGELRRSAREAGGLSLCPISQTRSHA